MAIETSADQMAMQTAALGQPVTAPGLRTLSDRLPRIRASSIGGLKLGRRIPIGIFLLLTLAAVLVPLLAPNDPFKPIGLAFQPPGSPGAIFGTDQVGRDMLTRMLYGFRSTWLWTLVIVGVGVGLGSIVGIIAGMTGGWVDRWLMRIADCCLAIPAQLLAISIVTILGRSLPHTVIALSFVWWAYFARILRAEVRAIVSRPHLEAARLAGVGRWRMSTRHVLPGIVPALIVTASHDIGNALLILGTLSFVGIGTPAPAPELGAMAAQGVTYLISNWWIPILPALVLFALTLTMNICGDVLRNQMVGR